jgi:hypothetical protein
MTTKSKSKKAVKSKRVAKKPAQRQTKAPIVTTPSANGNPFRQGSSYSQIYGVLASHPEGLTREDLLKQAMKAVHKDARHTGYDLSVILSAKASGKRHRSCPPGFFVEKTGDGLLKLRTT